VRHVREVGEDALGDASGADDAPPDVCGHQRTLAPAGRLRP
jgi:hypothetical protein